MNAVFVAIHVTAGSLAILSGFASLVPRKGSKWHVNFGRAFFYSMLVMAGTASLMGFFISHEPINGAIGLYTLYLVLTSQWTITNRKGIVTIKEKVGGLAAALLLGYFILLSYEAYQSGKSAITGVYVEAFYVYTVLAGLALVLDIKVILKKGVYGAQRIARHVWRMVLALFIASGSLFLGQPQVFPKLIRDSGTLVVPVLIVVFALFYWIIRVYVGKRFRLRKVNR